MTLVTWSSGPCSRICFPSQRRCPVPGEATSAFREGCSPRNGCQSQQIPVCGTVAQRPPQLSRTLPTPRDFPQQRVRWAQALYDFEALEDDELGFRSGEVVEVLDSSNPSWWTGRLHNKLGLFPANYVAPMIR